MGVSKHTAKAAPSGSRLEKVHVLSHPAFAPTAAAWWALIGVQICFASFPATGKLALQGFSPWALCFWRVACAALVFAVLAAWRHGRKALPTWGELIPAVLLSLLGITLNQLFFLLGLAHSSAVRGGLLVMIIPIMTLAWAVLRRHERLGLGRAAGVGCAALGVLFLVGDSLFADGFSADGFFLANAACYAVYLVEVRRLLQRHAPVVVVAWMFVLALPPVAWLARNESLWPATATSSQQTALLWVVLVPTVFAYLLNIYALQRLAASVTAVFVCFQPLLAGSLAVVLLGETLSWRDGATFVLVVFGVWLASRDNTAHKHANSAESQGSGQGSR